MQIWRNLANSTRLYAALAAIAVGAGCANSADAVADNKGSAAPIRISAPETVTAVPAAAVVTTSKLPPYDFPFDNGLYATAAGYLGVKHVCLNCEATYPLCIEGFCDKFPVKAVIQDGPAPLVIYLLGIGGRPEDDFSRLWPSWYAEAGYHVLTFQSTFLQDFNAHSQHGVSGNTWAETEQVKKIVAAFLTQTCIQGRVTKIGVVGMSYGGVEALMLGALAADKKLPFEIAAIQSYSPPISLPHSAKIVDDWYLETRNQYTLVELLKLTRHVPDRGNPSSPIPDCMLKAAAAASFRLTLPGLIAYNDANYHLDQLPKGDEFDDRYNREYYASKWTFLKFAYGMSYPYWQGKLGLQNLDPLVHAADLSVLLAKQHPSSEIIIAEDDPLDTKEDMQQFKATTPGKHITFLPRGGHLGYISEPWTRAKLMTLFDGK